MPRPRKHRRNQRVPVAIEPRGIPGAETSSSQPSRHLATLRARAHTGKAAIGQARGMSGCSGGRAGRGERAGERAGGCAGGRGGDTGREGQRAGGRLSAWTGGWNGWGEGSSGASGYAGGSSGKRASVHVVQGATRHEGGRADGRAAAGWVWRAAGWLPARGDIQHPPVASGCHATSARHREIP